MSLQLDSVEIATLDLEGALADYRLVLGVEPTRRGDAHRFQLGRGAVEIVTGTGGLRALRFVADPEVALPVSFHGLTVHVDPPEERQAAAGSPVVAIDHVVVQTTDPERAIGTWRDQLGLRLALDRAFAERGLRLLFFRSGGITLEYACAIAPSAGEWPDRFHGVSYRVPQLRQWHSRLTAAGVDVSEIRAGMRPGTSVCTVRSGTAGVPTLMLSEEPVASG
jgi:catechol 2,3-dioxygenase-like lactoylglutathione lyase family enzyme